MAIGHMRISQRGIDLIKNFEGFRAQSYKAVPTEQYYTIGYGHYGPNVRFAQVITKAEAEELLENDLIWCMDAVNALDYHYDFNQNQFDALCSFTFNCGKGNLIKLTDNQKRSKAEIAEKILLYNKAGGKTLQGLVNRRKAEHDLFISGSDSSKPIYKIAEPTLRRRCKSDKVKLLQKNMNDLFSSGIAEDESFGPLTQEALKIIQGKCNIKQDGIYGPITYGKFKDKARSLGYEC